MRALQFTLYSLFLPALLSSLLTVSPVTHAASDRPAVHVVNAQGADLENAVVYAEPAAGTVLPKPGSAEIQQKDRKFLPLVSVIQTGTSVSFPNNDTVKHHAYSFSTPKPFELKLYSGKPSAPLVFDQPGTVVVGCNIHDQMVAYIQIVNTPYFAKTDARGIAHLPAMPVGKYTLKVWHYQQAAGSAVHEQPWQTGTDTAPLLVKLPL
ncbi:methylamine utilization protein [Undibacterium oligocarboniphilum]|uniref:Methylamine utilization protein n=1 Tax=Undibacterium oligocarboniphilum TaxID=666702 RepID=A0A850QPC5_9BURK|nr:methylamine utilization protein [Undibacterium oligocarboniphilum]MBC3869548.1 methylamine utilization protein [Undibacterium oligocarboniphilum]NVO77926.1 methylamine utilization protein [Undibacterium oligocarboniphilum]